MKKMTKKLGAIILALAMCFSLCCTALVSAADETYTITISNTTKGQTYAAYKIFDATYQKVETGTDDNDEPIYTTAVSYTITDDNAWFDIIVGDTEAVNGVYTTDIFKLTPTSTKTVGDETVTTYTVEAVGSDSDIISFFNSQIKMTEIVDETTGEGTGVWELTAPKGVEPAATGTGTGSSEDPLVLDVSSSGAGYYFVTSTLGAVVSITTTDPNAEIVDKNTPPGNLKKDIVNGLDVDDSEHADAEAMGDDVEFKVTADVPLYAPADTEHPEGYLVVDYEFDDEMSTGLDIRGLTENEDYTYTNGKYLATSSLINSWIWLTGTDGSVYYLVNGTVDDGEGGTKNVTGVAYDVTLELIYAGTDEHGNATFSGFTLTYYTVSEEVRDNLAINADGSIYQSAFDIETDYPANTSITIDYTAHVNSGAEYDNTNHIDMYWDITPFNKPTTPDPEYRGHSEDGDDVYVLELDVFKEDAETKNALAGAEFTLTGTNLNEVVTSTTYTYSPLTKEEYEEAKAAGTELWWVLVDTSTSTDNHTSIDPYDLDPDDPDLNNYVKDTQDNADPDYLYVAYTRTESTTSGLQPAADKTVTGVTGEDGTLTFKGLTEGTWILTEIKAPDGYNLLSNEITFTISVDEWETDETTGKVSPVWSITPDDVVSFDGTTGVISVTIDNSQGTELPGTGGIGTTIFYIIGGVLVAGAVVVLVTRRRMNREA